ncbi:phosphodiesterase [Mycobacterium yunnanensis]|uniref:phosphodiesterase n=1 Tax=Mycobacterium yunnanensis TaxID=368477 RepID=UPI0027E2F69E|nr:phosphodiesterase [Mycobacterium yunnanensis]
MKPSDIVALPLQLGSALRHRRVFHPLGILAAGRLERIAPPGEGLPVESADVLARVSKAVGIPGGLPDLIGLALRMPPRGDAVTPWDVLMVSAGSGRLTRFALRPTLSWTDTTLSTLMPLRYDDGWWWVTAEMTTEVGPGLSLDAVRDAVDGGGVRFMVQQAHGSGPFRPLAEITLTRAIPTDEEHDVSFDPTRNTTPGVGLGPQWLTELRERAYLRSRRGRHAPDQVS